MRTAGISWYTELYDDWSAHYANEMGWVYRYGGGRFLPQRNPHFPHP